METKVEHLVSLLANIDTSLKGVFQEEFNKIVEIILRKEQKNDTTIRGIEKAFDIFMQRVTQEQERLFNELKEESKKITDEKVSPIVKRQFNLTKKDIDKIKTSLSSFIDSKVKQMEVKVNSLEPRKGDRGEKGDPGVTPRENEIHTAFESSPVLKKFLNDWEEKVQLMLISRGGRTGFGGASVINKFLFGISTDTTPAITGSINGSNTDFVLPKAPQTNGLSLFLNGVRQREGSSNDYTIAGKTVTFADAPVSGDIIVADIIY